MNLQGSGPIGRGVGRIVRRVNPRAKWKALRLVDGGTPAGRIGSMEIRLARTVAEVKAAQALRYHVFYKELSAVPGLRTWLRQRDHDAFDPICDHLIVLDHAATGPKPAVVATCRLLRQTVAEAARGFYTAQEFALPDLIARKPGVPFLEVGRSCVLPAYRAQRTVDLMLTGIYSYAMRHEVGALIGCGSLMGTDLDKLAAPLSYLYHHALAPADWVTAPLPGLKAEMNRMPAEAVNVRAAREALPPLIKGYLRLGARVGDGAVVDHQFGTTDVLIILPVEYVARRYLAHFFRRDSIGQAA